MRFQALFGGLLAMLAAAPFAGAGAAEGRFRGNECPGPQALRRRSGAALLVSRWIKGQKLDRFEPGKAYVLDFWATWCGPCIESFPHLTRLQKQYADKGLTVIGVSIWEEDQGVVDPFVKARSDAMGFSVALDDVPGGAPETPNRERAAARRPTPG